MTIWDVLEIDQTSDLKSIKRAYARKLKTIDRSSDIEGFQNLRDAYDSATYYASLASDAADTPAVFAPVTASTPKAALRVVQSRSSGEPDTDDARSATDSGEVEVEFGHNVEEPTRASAKPDYGLIWEEIGQYMRTVDALLDDEEHKHDPSAWQTLWEHPLLSQLISKELLYDELFAYFAQVTPSIEEITAGDKTMPEFVLPRYDDIFSWSADEISLARRHSEDDIDRLLLLASHHRMQSRLRSAEQDISSFGRIYIWATGLIILAMLIKSWFF